jgi:hypothetical protein
MAHANRLACIGLGIAAVLLLGPSMLAQPKAAGEDRKEPAFTAFPRITMPRKEVQLGDRKGMWPDFEKVYSRLTAGYPRPIPANAAPLAKVRTAQVNESVGYFRGIVPRFGLTESERDFLPEMLHVSNDLFRVAAAAEPTAAGKQGLFEDRVALFKYFERVTQSKVDAGSSPANRLNLARFYRLQAEAELILLRQSSKAEK